MAGAFARNRGVVPIAWSGCPSLRLRAYHVHHVPGVSGSGSLHLSGAVLFEKRGVADDESGGVASGGTGREGQPTG